MRRVKITTLYTLSHQPPLRRERRSPGGVKTTKAVVCLDYGGILSAKSQSQSGGRR
jgi:hypothetical protein